MGIVKRNELIHWLLEEGGPSIRYRTARELAQGETWKGQETILIESPLVCRWLENLRPELGFNQLHGAAPRTFESAMGKLTQLGCRAGMPEFDRRTQIFRAWFQEVDKRQQDENFSWIPFLKMLAAPFLARAGYHHEPSLRKFAADRLRVLYQFTRRGRFDLYIASQCALTPVTRL